MPGYRPLRWRYAAVLLLTLAAGAGGAAPLAQAQSNAEPPPVWAFDPGEPGPDRPPVGRSLFDRLFAAERDGTTVTDVPFPFAALRQRLMGHLGPDAANSDVLAQVLIPLGRALQRNAAAPDYFASPRLVLAVVGDPLSPPRETYGLGGRLKDRLYIGYQAKAQSLEVISYNEAAGRFEFQIVEDYAPGRTPRVVYAQRAVCVACHQNGAPIFSQPPWSETNADAEVARRLAARAAEFHGVAAEDGSRPFDQALLISTAVVKANLYGAYQRIWRQGCGDGLSAIPCRAALLTAALQFKLSGGRHFDRSSETYRDDLAVPLRRAWERTWRSGLAIPDALIANRDPLADGFDVTAADDPLRARPPLGVWTGEDPGDLEAVVAGLAQLLSASDAARLDQRLRDLARDGALPRSIVRAPCAVSRRSLEGWGERFLFRCESDGPDGLLLNGHFYVRPQARLEGAVPWLVLSTEGAEAKFEDLAIAADELGGRNGRTSVSFRPLNRRDGLHARLADGSVIETIALTWAAAIEDGADPSAEIPDHPANGEVVLTAVQDFAPVHEAVALLVSQTEQGAPGVFSSTAFHGGRAMAAVLAALGVGSLMDCCGDDKPMPPVVLDRSAPDPAPGVHQTFARFCAACHATAGPFPPNFLSGGTRSVDPAIAPDGIALCAERIAFRLAMWDRPDVARRKSPMPPESWLRSAGWTPAAWRDGTPRAVLGEHLAGLLARAGTSAQEVEQRGRQAYEALQPCLGEAE
jgi:mono/diheme cytochrome c family protein